MQFTDEQIRSLLRDPARHPPSARHLGLELIDFSVDEGWAEMAFMPRAEFANPAGMVQGGFVCAMLDDAMGLTASISQRFAILVPTLQIGQLPAPHPDVARHRPRRSAAHGRHDGAPARQPAVAGRHAARHRLGQRRPAPVSEVANWPRTRSSRQTSAARIHAFAHMVRQ